MKTRIKFKGSIHNLQARGCHALIKQGAGLVESSSDVIDALGAPLQRALVALHERLMPALPASQRLDDVPEQRELALSHHDLSASDRALLTILATQSATTDELMTHCTLSVSQLAAQLGLLEARGLIRTSTGGRYVLGLVK